MHLQPLQQQHAACRRVGAQQRLVRAALPFQLPGQSSSSRKPTDQQQQQQLAPAPAVTQQQQQQQQVVPFDPSAASSVATPSPLKFAKHLANVSNGCAPPMTRFESLGWLLFESKRLQASLLGPNTRQQAAASSWLSSAQGVQLLEQIYLVGAAIAELGTADGLQPLSSSNGSRAIVSLDYSRLLERYLQQHGHLLSEGFWSQLHAYDDLQARAIHVATALETRCMVHAMLFDKLIDRVGTEPSAAAAAGAWGVGAAGWAPQGSAPLATAITNTMINTTQQHSAPVTTQSTVASPSAVTSNSGNNSNVASSSQTAGTQPAVHGVWGWLGQLGAVFLLLCTVAGKVVHIVIAVVSFAKDVVVQLLMLRAVSAGANAVASKAGSEAQLQPAVAVAAGTLPPADAVQARQLPGAAAGSSLELPQHAPGAVPAPAAAADSLGAAGAAAPLQAGQQLTTAHCEPPAQAEPVAQQLPVVDAQPSAAAPAAQQQQQQPRADGDTAKAQRARLSPQQWLRGAGGVRSGLKGGLGAAQQVLHRAAAKVGATAASIPTVLLQQQQAQQGSKSFKTESGHLLYSLWSPAEAGLQELELEAAAAGVQFADAGWGVRGSNGMGAAVCSAEECW